MKRLSAWLLRHAETFYLHMHGWKCVGPDEWTAPPGWCSRRAREGFVYGHSHAVNSTKFYSRPYLTGAAIVHPEDDLEAKLRASLKQKKGT